MSLAPGANLNNRYRIVSLLGQGGFGAVYKAWDLNMQAHVALKENLDPTPEAARQFALEATILFKLRHPNLPRVTDHFTIPGQGQYLVMDFISGHDLQTVIDQKGSLPEKWVVKWIGQVCDALDYLHSQNPPIIHRDIKPANIRVTPEGQALLVDFGIAKAYDPQHKTTVGARAVTPGYSPQEQYGQGRTDARSDLYALGATLYACLTGQVPVESVQRNIAGVDLDSPRQQNPSISQHVEQVMLKAIAMQPTDRYQTASEFKSALLSATATGPVPASLPATVPTPVPQTKNPTPSRRRSSSWIWLAVGGVMVLLLVVIAGFAFWNVMDQQWKFESTQTSVAMFAARATVILRNTNIPLSSTKPVPIATKLPPTLLSSLEPIVVAIETQPSPLATHTLAALQTQEQGVGQSDCTAIGKTINSFIDGMPMMCVPAGEFTMGSTDQDEGAEIYEKPQHTVYLDAFWIDRTEVTNAMYALCVQTGACLKPHETKSEARSIYYGNTQYVDYPVIYVDWDQAKTYCEWAGRRLPTEAEWEKAARGTDGRDFPWGNRIACSYANFLGKYNGCIGDTTKVGSYPSGASPYGALDMAGNVSEWVMDCYAPDYYSQSPSNNPTGPSCSDSRVLRGGSWGFNWVYIRTAVRKSSVPDYYGNIFGFRCARIR